MGHLEPTFVSFVLSNNQNQKFEVPFYTYKNSTSFGAFNNEQLVKNINEHYNMY